MDNLCTCVRDRVEGILFGLAAGDRNGGPSRMAVRLAESLVACEPVDVDDIARRYLDWWHEEGFDTGPTAARVFDLVDSGLTFDQASRQVHAECGAQTAGCNPAHRSTPLAMIPDMNAEELAQSAIKEATLTHRHPLSGDVAAAVVLTCRALVRGAAWSEAIESASAERLPETKAAMTGQVPAELNRGGFAPDVLAAALYFVGSNETFATALGQALRFAGRANYCPVLVGSIGGARWGASSIPNRWVRHCGPLLLQRVRATATCLSSRWM